ncbi:MAG TPA: YccF domain-containing protein [Arenibaculum sp.]|nr:YccF domain-containing protein [Arenibaculum sp.]
MNAFSLLLNVLWVVTGGIWAALAWFVAAAIMALTIIGLPWARAAVTIAGYTFLPFGRKAVPRDEYYGVEDLGTGPVGFIGNLVWLLLAGWWLALGHLALAVTLAITIIGLPFAWAHLKLALLSLWPVGKTIVSSEDYDAHLRGVVGR